MLDDDPLLTALVDVDLGAVLYALRPDHPPAGWSAFPARRSALVALAWADGRRLPSGPRACLSRDAQHRWFVRTHETWLRDRAGRPMPPRAVVTPADDRRRPRSQSPDRRCCTYKRRRYMI